ncbi:MAG TPA: ROK family protein [Stellaceae bacterium]
MSRGADAAPGILGIDIGGTHLKAGVVDGGGHLLAETQRIDTPYPCPPAVMIDALVALARPLPPYDRISIGFPGVVRDNRVLTAPHYGTPQWADFPLAAELSRRLHGAPAKLINDAEMQGLFVIAGQGLELVLTLGTGAGTGLFRDGDLMPHLELAQHPLHKKKTYNDYIGDKALKKIGAERWNRRVQKTIDILFSLLHYEHLFIGGGNSTHVSGELPASITLVSNDAGIEGGAALWRDLPGQG